MNAAMILGIGNDIIDGGMGNDTLNGNGGLDYFLASIVTNLGEPCALDPTVTPDPAILCPNSTDSLWTQEYNAYQWYRNGDIINGATNQYYVADANVDTGDLFHTYLRALGVKSDGSFLIGGQKLPIADPAHEPIRELLA